MSEAALIAGLLTGALPFVIFIAIALFMVSVIKKGIITASANEAIVISGLSKKPRLIIGKTGFMIPFLEKRDTLWLGQISVDIKTDEAVPTKDFIKVDVDAVAKVHCDISTPEAMELSIRNFLNMTEQEISKSIMDSLQGNMKEIISSLTLVELNTDRDKFSIETTNAAKPDMDKIGIDIYSFNIQTVKDHSGLIDALGAENEENIKMKSAKIKALADKETRIAQAHANKEATDIEIQTQQQIAEKNTDLDIKRSQLKQKADVARADADAAYKIRQAEQLKSINAAEVLAETEKMEKTSALKDAEIVLKEKELQATIMKEADARRYKTEIDAQADLVKEQKEAEAERYRIEQTALADKAKADAERYVKEQEALATKALYEAEAKGIQAKGEAEAASVKAKLEAEAEGMDRKAAAYAKYNNAAVINMIIEILPQMASEISKSIAQIDNITLYGGGNGDGVDSVAGIAPAMMKQTFDMISSTTGVDFTEIMKANTFDAKTTKNVNISGELKGLPEVPADSEVVKNILDEATEN